jgi:hypothetical protein
MRGATVILVISEGQSFRVYQTTTATAEGKYAFRGVRPENTRCWQGRDRYRLGSHARNALCNRAERRKRDGQSRSKRQSDVTASVN